MDITPESTRRAYTMRLAGTADDSHWRELLWKTHELTNRGAYAFGDWLLTMRGGLPHELAKGKTQEETRSRRIVLAMSWLSVESKEDSPEKFHVAQNWEDKKRLGQYKVVDALKDVLHKRGLKEKEIEEWVLDCKDSLEAKIRDDAVWVNRSDCFDDFCKEAKVAVNRNSAKNNLFFFISEEKYFLLNNADGEETKVPGNNDLNLVQLARKWLSNYWGSGKGNDKKLIKDALTKIAELDYGVIYGKSGTELMNYIAVNLKFGKAEEEWDVKRIKSCIGWRSGRSSAAAMALEGLATEQAISKDSLDRLVEKCGIDIKKIKVPNQESQNTQTWNENIRSQVERAVGVNYRDTKDHIDEFSVMLDHGARHVSVAHSWMLRQEAERIKFSNEAALISKVPKATKEYLDNYCEQRTETSNALGDYVIRKRAIEGWKDVVKAWAASDCQTTADRVKAARDGQAEDTEGGKFGDINLFEALAEEDAVCVWRNDRNTADPTILENYVKARWAETQMKRFKVPMYRHPDALRHPVFCDFGASRFSIEYAAQKPKKDVPLNSLILTVYDGQCFKDLRLHWQSERLMKDIMRPVQNQNSDAVVVSRADRLGRAAGGADNTNELTIVTIKKWDGRLQAPRRQMENIWRHLKDLPEKEKCTALKQQLPYLDWFITFSPELQPHGPWIDYVENHDIKTTSKFLFKWAQKLGKRGTLAYARLCRLPDLRVVSVDLGHRYAASCAVMQTLSKKRLEAMCKAAGIKPPTPDALYFTISETANGKPHKTWFRRIGPDTLPDGKEHPAPWARIERQFTVKLDGEDDSVRKARKEEINNANKFFCEIGVKPDDCLKSSVDDLMDACVRQYRLALRRHGDVARIASAMTAAHRYGIGARKEMLTKETALEEKLKVLMLWEVLCRGEGTISKTAKSIWNRYLKVHTDRLGITDKIILTDDPESPRKRESKAQLNQRKEAHTLLAQQLTEEECKAIKNAFTDLWNEQDDLLRKRLKWLRRWLMPRNGHWPNVAGVGGLSLARIVRLQELYRVNKAFYTRLTPDGRQMVVSGDDGEEILLTAKVNFGQRMLDQFEELRDNRVKQLASRIAAAALGLDNKLQPRFEPCHAVVIENLDNYRPDELRTRRENTMLMRWASGKVRDCLAHTCMLNGLLLVEVSANYTSRQDSRTGAPGIRCNDVSVKEFFNPDGYMQKKVVAAKERLDDGKAKATDLFLIDINNAGEKSYKRQEIRLPQTGGELFVSADSQSPAAKGLQADINAAVNIGLRALTDPDWHGRWWYVPFTTKDGKPRKESVEGAAVFPKELDFPVNIQKSDKRDVVNLWRDVAEKPFTKGTWKSTTEYWEDATKRVLDVLRAWNGLSQEEEIPY